MRIHMIATLAAIIFAPAAHAASPISLESAVFVERMDQGRAGRMERKIEPADQIARGDKLVMMLEWIARDDGKGFDVTIPIPTTITFQRSGRENERVSADGGRSWGRLGALTIREGLDMRLASPADVTHVRWTVSPREAAAGRGRITYSAYVR